MAPQSVWKTPDSPGRARIPLDPGCRFVQASVRMHSPQQKQPAQAPPAGPATLRARAQSQQAARVSSTPQACAGARGQIASIAKEAPSSVRLAPRDCNKKQQASPNDYLRIPFLPPSSASRILAARATRLFAASGRRAPGMPPATMWHADLFREEHAGFTATR